MQKVLAETPAHVEEVVIEKERKELCHAKSKLQDGSYRIVEEEQEEGAAVKDARWHF